MNARETNAQSTPGSWLERRGVVSGIMAAILVVAAWFRIHDLQLAAYRSDEIVFYNLCSQPIPPMEIVRRWMELTGITGQFPFAMAFTKWFMTMFNLSATPVALRMPSAIWGVLSVAAAYGLGACMHSKSTGLMLAALLALNPMHIQICREAYYYAPLVFGAVLLWWATLWAFGIAFGQQAAKPSFYVLVAAGFFLMAYSQPTGWPVAAVLLLVIVSSLALKAKKERKLGQQLVIAGALCVIVGVPLLTNDWALKHLIQNASGATKAAAAKAVAVAEGDTWLMIGRTLTSFAWGSTAVRVTFTVMMLLAGLAFTVQQGRINRRYWLLPAALVVGFLFYLVSRGASSAAFESRYIAGLLPAYLLLLTLGMAGAATWLARCGLPEKKAAAGPAVLFAAGIALNAQPALWCTQLTGYPTPYYAIVNWMDSHLPRGTPVIVDRWFEPWNELKVHPSTNVNFTFTIPNEPLDTFLQTRWRDTVTNFFERFPNAAYLELAKQYWQVPGVGTWEWPRQYFAQHVGITNVAGLNLRKTGLANRGDFYWSTTNRVVVDIFYNTREDLIERWKKQGSKYHVLFGTGWEYTKTQDYRDWRMLKERAQVEVINLGQTSVVGVIRMRAVAANGAKRVRVVQGIEHEFPAQKLDQWDIGPLEVPVGINIFPIQDVLAPLVNTPLLVESMDLLIATQAVSKVAAPAPEAAAP